MFSQPSAYHLNHPANAGRFTRKKPAGLERSDLCAMGRSKTIILSPFSKYPAPPHSSISAILQSPSAECSAFARSSSKADQSNVRYCTVVDLVSSRRRDRPSAALTFSAQRPHTLYPAVRFCKRFLGRTLMESPTPPTLSALPFSEYLRFSVKICRVLVL